MMLLLIIFSFFMLYRKGKYDYASYTIGLILCVETVSAIFIYRFDDYIPAFLFPLILGIFSLFSWKKGLVFSFIIIAVIGLLLLYCQDDLQSSVFLQNPAAIVNFISVFVIVVVFAFYYETTRIDAYRQLIEVNDKKDLLYNEIQHRVKNNLNIVSSMLAIQAEKEDQKVRDIIKVSKSRIDAMAMVHSMLYVSHDLEKVNAKGFIEKLYRNIQSTLSEHVNIHFKADTLELSLNEVIPIGLIINELLVNSFKYAFKTEENPKIIIVLKRHNDTILLTYFDNGSGYDATMKRNFGLQLVDLNVKQLKGTLKVSFNHGLCYQIAYKRDAHV
jgi:two-component system, sensor histidine kinase PdtaS